MNNLSDFLPYVLPSVVGCTDPLAEQTIRDICIDFCTISGVVQVTLDPITIYVGQIDYTMDLPSGTQAHLIIEAWLNSQRLGLFKTGDVISRPELYNMSFDGAATNIGAPSAIKQAADNSFKLDAASSVRLVNALTLTVSTKPTRKSVRVDSILFNDYAYEIGQGAIARLQKIPGKPWSNAPAAMGSEEIYIRARTDARIRAEASFSQAETRVRPRKFQ